MANVLIIDDEITFARNAAKFLEKAGHVVRTAATAAAGMQLFAEGAADVVVLDYRLPDEDGISIIRRLRVLDATVPILMITGHGTIELAVAAMKIGANDLLVKPVSLASLRQRIGEFDKQRLESGRLRYFEARERRDPHEIVGNSDTIRALRERISRIASVDGADVPPPVLILGETGSGKELVARAVHFESARAARPFIELNCAAIPANLLESELFGHERGAFTDAKERKMGLLEAADGGSIFLDEIGEMDLGLQAKLLKVIEDGRFRRLGAVQERQVNLRIVAATNQDLEARIRNGTFRADLFFRLRVLRLDVPPLRDRGEDCVILAEHFVELCARRYRRDRVQLNADAIAAIRKHGWPGNVRELKNVIEQAVLLSSGEMIGVADLLLPAASMPAAENDRLDGTSALDRVEREMLVQALRQCSGNVSRAARELGISRDTLRYRMEKHGLRN